MSGVPNSAFTEAVRLTGPTVFTGPKAIINDAQKTNYNTLGYIMRGQKMSDVVQGGFQIVDDIFLTAVRKARAYREGQKQSYSNPQTGVQISCPWRQYITDITWSDTERELNAGAAREGDRGQMLKDLWFKKQMITKSDYMDFQEELCWSIPDTTRMEATNGDLTMSFPAYINEFANALPTAVFPGGAWTTKLGVAVASNANWVPQQFAYGNASVGSSMNALSLISVFKKAFTRLGLRPPPANQEYFENESASPVGVVFCSEKAQTFLWQQYLASQNRWDDQMDPWGNPKFNGTSIVHVAQLDGYAGYPTGSAAAITTATLSTEDAVTNTTAINAGPRYYCIQPEYMRMIYHSKFTMHSLGVMDDRAQPTSHTIPMLTWQNLFARSLRRHGIIYPTAITGGGSGGIVF